MKVENVEELIAALGDMTIDIDADGGQSKVKLFCEGCRSARLTGRRVGVGAASRQSAPAGARLNAAATHPARPGDRS
jgi:hypothetical protein